VNKNQLLARCALKSKPIPNNENKTDCEWNEPPAIGQKENEKYADFTTKNFEGEIGVQNNDANQCDVRNESVR
jgi:hypothetical protein